MGGGSAFEVGGGDKRWADDVAGSIVWGAVCGSNNPDGASAETSARYIISTNLTVTAHGGDTGAFTLQYENNTDNPGTWADVATGEEILPHTSLGAITNGDPVGDSNGCATNVDSEEVEDESPLTSGSLTVGQNEFCELQYCISMASSLAGKVYNLRCWDETAGAVVAGSVMQITTAAGATDEDTTFNMDGYIAKNFDTNFNMDGYVAKNFETNFNMDGYIAKSFDTNLNMDGYVAKDFETTFTMDAQIDPSTGADVNTTFNMDGYIAKNFDTNFNLDGYIAKNFDNNFNMDGYIAKDMDTTFTMDAQIDPGGVGVVLKINGIPIA